MTILRTSVWPTRIAVDGHGGLYILVISVGALLVSPAESIENFKRLSNPEHTQFVARFRDALNEYRTVLLVMSSCIYLASIGYALLKALTLPSHSRSNLFRVLTVVYVYETLDLSHEIS